MPRLGHKYTGANAYLNEAMYLRLPLGKVGEELFSGNILYPSPIERRVLPVVARTEGGKIDKCAA